jgi:Carboxypeptidase regulatory-like domain
MQASSAAPGATVEKPMPSNRFLQCLLWSVLFFVAIGNSQVRETLLQGQVVDASGAPVPETRLLVVNLNSLEEQRAVVKEKGKFSFQQLPPGDYALIAAAPVDTPCFRPVVERVKLEADTTRNIKLVMIANPGACAANQ